MYNFFTHMVHTEKMATPNNSSLTNSPTPTNTSTGPNSIHSLYYQHVHHSDVGASVVMNISNSQDGGVNPTADSEEEIMMEDVEREHQAGMMEEFHRSSSHDLFSKKKDKRKVPSFHKNKHHTHKHVHRTHLQHHSPKQYKKPGLSQKPTLEHKDSTLSFETHSDVSSSSFDNISVASSADLEQALSEQSAFKFIDDGSNGVLHDKRQHFGSIISFLFAAIGSSVGLGDLIRFPYLVFTFGGSFLIPYIFCLIVLGIPMTLLEFSLGVMARRSSILSISKWNRRACGVGLATTIFGSLLILSYYNVFLSWTCVYFVNLFQHSLPWIGAAEEFFNSNVLMKSKGPTTLTSIYPSNFIVDINFISIPILLGLIVVTILNFLSAFKGVTSIKTVVFVSVPLPICLLFIYLLRTILFEEGGMTGISHFFKPDFSVLLNTEIWLAAAGQVFFSTGVGNGTNPTYSSYVSRKSNIIIASIIVVLANCFIALVSGCTIFAILGVMAHDKFGANAEHQFSNLFSSDTASSGLGLAFIVYFQAVSYLPVPHFSALLLIITIFSMGLDSAFACVECVTSAIMDHYAMKWNLKIQRWKYVQEIYQAKLQYDRQTSQTPDASENPEKGAVIASSPVDMAPPESEELLHESLPEMPFRYRIMTNRNVATAIACLLGFLLGIPFTLTNGYYLIKIVDHHVSNYCLVIMGLAECIVVGYFAYGSIMFEAQTSALNEHVVISKMENLADSQIEGNEDEMHDKWTNEVMNMIEPEEEEVVSHVLKKEGSKSKRFLNWLKNMAIHFVVFFKYLIHCPNLVRCFKKFQQAPTQHWKRVIFFSIDRFKNHVIAKKQKIIEKYAAEEADVYLFRENSLVYKCTDATTQLFLWIWSFLIKFISPTILSVMVITTMITETFTGDGDEEKAEAIFSLSLGWTIVGSCLLCMIWFAIFPFVARDVEVFGRRGPLCDERPDANSNTSPRQVRLEERIEVN